jgi:hypothetical protein
MLTTASGTTRTSQHVRAMSAIGGKATVRRADDDERCCEYQGGQVQVQDGRYHTSKNRKEKAAARTFTTSK